MNNDDVPADLPEDPQERLEYITGLLRRSEWDELPGQSQASISQAHDQLAEAIAYILVAENDPDSAAAEMENRDVWIDESIDDERVEEALNDLGIPLENRE